MVTVVFVIGDPVDLVERPVILFQGIGVVVPEPLKAFFLCGHYLLVVGKEADVAHAQG